MDYQTHSRDLNLECTQKIMDFRPYIVEQAKGDDDLIQESYIGIYDIIKEKSKPKESYFKTKIHWKMVNYGKQGKSVDNGFWKRDKLRIVRTDQFDNYLSSNILKDLDSKPVDEQVIDKITFENFLGSLSELEKKFVHRRIIGWTFIKIMKKLKLRQELLDQIRKSVRYKIKTAYS